MPVPGGNFGGHAVDFDDVIGGGGVDEGVQFVDGEFFIALAVKGLGVAHD